MSEKIYAWLLHLYPSRFREAYGDEALQLFRDRARDEKGFLLSVRLWLDLLVDLVVSIPGEYRYVRPALISASAQQRLNGLPSFHVLEGEWPHLGALLSGGVLSLIALLALWVSISHVGNYRPLDSSVAQSQRPVYARSSTFRHLEPQAADHADQGIVASGHPTLEAGSPGNKPSNSQLKRLLLPAGSESIQSQFPQPRPQEASSAKGDNMKLDAAERQRVLVAAVDNLKQHYPDPGVAQKMADSLLALEKTGDDDAAADGAAFAGLLTRQMREVSQDMHLVLVYNQATLPEHPMAQTPGSLASYRNAMEQQNCAIEKVQILPHNIGYLKINSFPDPSVCQQKAAGAMASLNGADAIIFDLRDNTGGFPDMVAMIASYLFDHPEYWYNPRENTTQQSWTRSPVPGSMLADKPVYVLTSARTISGAEQFSYDLKMLKRATLVGEKTAGGAHAGVFHRIDDHFGMGIPETRPINPFSKADWEGTGVEPNVKVKAAEALETAEKLAEGRLEKK